MMNIYEACLFWEYLIILNHILKVEVYNKIVSIGRGLPL